MPQSRSPSAPHEPDTSPTRLAERWGWWLYGFGAEGYSAVGQALFIPVVIERLAAQAGVQQADHTLACSRGADADSAAHSACVVPIAGLYIETSSLVLYTTTIATLVQLVLFLGLGGAADFGAHRKMLLMMFATACAIVTIGFLGLTQPQYYWVGCLLLIVSSACYGVTFVFHYAWIPVLVRNDPRVRALQAEQRLQRSDAAIQLLHHQFDAHLHRVSHHASVSDGESKHVSLVDVGDASPTIDHSGTDAEAEWRRRGDLSQLMESISNQLSTYGFALQYLASTVQLVVFAVLMRYWSRSESARSLFASLPETYPAQVCLALSALWYLACLVPTQMLLRPRPGPPLPAGHNLFLFGFKRVGHTLRQARRLPNLFRFLLGWFAYSDAFCTITSVSILIAEAELALSMAQLLTLVIAVNIVAGFGTLVWRWFQHAMGWSTKSILLLQVSMYLLFPVYCLCGFWFDIGLKSLREAYCLALLHGFLLGATQSTCRVLFGQLIPAGMESRFFALYEVTDKGSSWIGPLAVAALTDWTHDKRYAFIFLLAMFIIPLCIFATVDPDAAIDEARQFLRESGGGVDDDETHAYNDEEEEVLMPNVAVRPRYHDEDEDATGDRLRAARRNASGKTVGWLDRTSSLDDDR